MVRWPGLVPLRSEINDVFSAEDWAATLVAAAGEPDIKEKLPQGYDAAGKNFRVHLDGYDQRDLLAGKGPDKQREFFYWTDDGNLAGLRYLQWKAAFMEQQAEGLDVWAEPLAQHESGDYVRGRSQRSLSPDGQEAWRGRSAWLSASTFFCPELHW